MQRPQSGHADVIKAPYRGGCQGERFRVLDFPGYARIADRRRV